MRCLIVLAASLISSSLLGAGLDRKLVSAEARWVLHLDFEAGRESQIGKHILASPIPEETKQKLESLKVLFNFDLLNDIHDVTAYGADPASKLGKGVMIVNARYDKEKWMAVLRLGKEFKTESYGKHSLMKLTKNQNITGVESEKREKVKASWGVMCDEHTIVFAREQDALRHALDVMDGKAASLPKATDLALNIPCRRPVLQAMGDLQAMQNLNPRAQTLKEVKAFSFCFWERGEGDSIEVMLNLHATAGSAELAKRLRRTLDGLVAMTQIKIDADPELGLVSDLLDNVTISNDKQELNLTFRCPAPQFVTALDKLRKAKQRAERSAPTED